MIKFKSKQSSIVYKLTRLILGIIVLQTLLLSGILIKGGVIDQAEGNAYQMFHDKVTNRKDYVQREMKNNWTNFDPYLSNITKLMSESDSNSKDFFENAMPELISMLRTTQATGAYIILESEESEQQDFPALYLRDYDPIMNSYSDDDIYMVYGPPELAKSLKIPMDQTWEYNFNITEENGAFIKKPYEIASMASKATLLGYWSKPFKLNENDVSIITYSIPFFDNSGKLRGIIGIDITLNYLAKLFPAAELQSQDSLGYLIAFSDDDGEQMVPILMGGALQKRMIDKDQALKLSPVDLDKHIYKIENHNGSENLYASVEKVGLYQYNTPFENEQWYLVGIMREDYLLSYANRIKQILWISLVVAIVIGAIGGALISYQMTKPIVALARQVKESDQSLELQLDPTGFLELDELSRSVKLANHLMLESASRLTKIVDMFGMPIGAFEVNHNLGRVFMTDNFGMIVNVDKDQEMTFQDHDAFMAMLKDLFSNPESDETDVYQIGKKENRWIRYKQSENADAMIGVVMDVTDEMKEKRQIKRERDHDGLTLLLNRKGFQWEFEKWRLESSDKASALLMFDLDNLKHVNDTYGHKWGDQYLILASEQLKRITNKERRLLGRQSGDEFVLLLHGFEDRIGIRQCLETFYQSLSANPIEFPDGTQMPVNISAGLMWIESEKLLYEELLHFADEALYVAKRSQKGYFVENQTFMKKN